MMFKFHMILLWFGCTLILLVNGYVKPFAVGNVEVIFNATSAKSGEDHPLKADVPPLWYVSRDYGVKWCQAKENFTKQILPVKKARFERMRDREYLPAMIDNETRAVLEFNTTTSLSAGAYRCEISVFESDDIVWGWMFVNMRPVFHFNNSKNYETDGENYFHLKGPAVRATEGETVTLSCPVIGFPKPTIEWFKDNVTVASTEQVTFLEQDLEIAKLKYENEGIYTCVARNSFNNGTYESWLSREVRVRGSFRWVYPLIVIVIMLLLLFIIIYACSAFNRYKSYNVEKKERRKKRQGSIINSESLSQQQQQPILGYNKNELE